MQARRLATAAEPGGGTDDRVVRFFIMENEAELRDAAERCRRMARGLAHLEALEMIALAYEYEERAEHVVRKISLSLVSA